jgi:hypothetical protein
VLKGVDAVESDAGYVFIGCKDTEDATFLAPGLRG